jgi:transcriptional regulator with XRE-family HTH domain
MANETLGERLKRLRIAAGLTQLQLGVAIGRDNGTISRIERGETKDPERETIEHLADELGLTYSELMFGEKPRAESETVRITAYPSLEEFLNSPMASDISPEEQKWLRSEIAEFRSAEGDPGFEYYVHKLSSYRAMKRFQNQQQDKPQNLAEGRNKYRKLKKT